MAERGTFLGEVEVVWRRFWDIDWGVKVALIVAVMVGFIILAVASSLGDDGSAPADAGEGSTPSPAASATNAPATETPVPTATATNTPSPTATPTETPTPTPSPTPGPPETLESITAGDLEVLFERLGFECSGPTRGQTMELWDRWDADGTLYVGWMGPSPTRIRSVSATAFEDDTVAGDFLGEVSRLPYEGADPDAAEAFVTSALATGGETVIGPAKLFVSGPPGGRSLDIVALGAE